MEYLPRLAFVVPLHVADAKQLIDFHLLLPMGYDNSAAYFCCATKTVANLANAT